MADTVSIEKYMQSKYKNTKYTVEEEQKKPYVNPCCYYPCQHKGICIQTEQDQYQCDCTRTGYYGPNCTIPLLWTRIWEGLSPSPSFTHFLLTHARWIWKLINATFLRDVLMRNILTSRTNLIPSPPTYNSVHGYISWESYANLSFYSRVLPPVPEDCPTPMGVKGKKELPDPEVLVTSFLLRKEFVPDPQGSNLMFAFFAQHFIHQFFKTSGKMGSAFTSALSHGVDLNQVYGDNPQRQYQLRLFKDGKLKFQMLDGEMYPPSVAETQAFMNYPSSVPKSHQMAVGNEELGKFPGLMMYATIWLREHNRVCDILRAEHPSWKDEQLFQTARLILIGDSLKIL
ncbi:prostaglandin G/H synthase 1-like [Gracilinanus agilis]|uniref:prostaglandin G/H synthase 1-like n=1 Tax=Gracilinanus agilis TaxID=191870 RepID=UPI001CFCF395|nr:prostaglandin G/H synthase 1-like [Gracilinanus agilis]